VSDGELYAIFLDNLLVTAVSKLACILALHLVQAFSTCGHGWRCSASDGELDAIFLDNLLVNAVSNLACILAENAIADKG